MRIHPASPGSRLRAAAADRRPAPPRRVTPVHMGPRVGHEHAARVSRPDGRAPHPAGNDWLGRQSVTCAATSGSRRLRRSAYESAYNLQHSRVADYREQFHPQQFHSHGRSSAGLLFQQQRRQRSAGPSSTQIRRREQVHGFGLLMRRTSSPVTGTQAQPAVPVAARQIMAVTTIARSSIHLAATHQGRSRFAGRFDAQVHDVRR